MPKELTITQGETLNVTVRARNTEYFNGKAAAVSSINNKGPFDILPKHTHFISLIQKGIVIHQSDGSQNTIDFEKAVLRVKDDTVEIYIATPT